MGNWRFYAIGQLGRRLALAFVAVALAAILINLFIIEESVGPEITAVVIQQERGLTRAMALTAGAAYQGIGWARADLRPVGDLARRAGAAVQVRDRAGRLIGGSPRFGSFPAATERREPVVVGGRLVGRVRVRFGSAGLGAIAGKFESERLEASLAAAGVAALLALLVSLAVARQITRPLDRMLGAARARTAGDRSVRVDPVTGVGVVRELLGVFNQATDAVDQQDRVRRNLVANVAHELRTPVAVLQAGHEAMLDGVTEPNPENLGSLRDEVLRLGRMVADLQALASAEAAALQLSLVPHDLAEVAAGAAESLGDSFVRKGVRLTTRLTGVRVSCDEARVREIVTNLLTNALKFTQAGGSVLLRTGPAGGQAAMLGVTDTGIGIPADDLPFVTERFFRGRRSADSADGSGIGLTIVAELVRAHHGELSISSEPGQGTTVAITLPRAAASDGRRGGHPG